MNQSLLAIVLDFVDLDIGQVGSIFVEEALIEVGSDEPLDILLGLHEVNFGLLVARLRQRLSLHSHEFDFLVVGFDVQGIIVHIFETILEIHLILDIFPQLISMDLLHHLLHLLLLFLLLQILLVGQSLLPHLLLLKQQLLPQSPLLLLIQS